MPKGAPNAMTSFRLDPGVKARIDALVRRINLGRPMFDMTSRSALLNELIARALPLLEQENGVDVAPEEEP